MTTLTDLTADELSRGLAARRFSCRELLRATLDRIAAINPRHNAIVALRDESALLAEADQRDAELARGLRRGWLHGVPQATKDTTATRGLVTTLGSPLLAGFVPAHDELIVARARAAGAVFIGKTNAPEFGLGSHTFNEVYGTTRNAWDRTRTAGGSSGGAAVALATRMLAVADGSDFMGSLRNPAGWNHVLGLRPSQGRVPYGPADDVFVTQLPTCGPMARNALDLARMLDLQAGPDPRAPLAIDTVEAFGEAVARATADDARGVRIGWLADLGGYLATEPGVLAVCEQALARLAGGGAIVEPLAPPFDPARAWATWLVWRQWLVAGRIGALLAKPGARDKVKPEALWEFDSARGLTGADTLRASAERSRFYQAIVAAFDRVDVLALPSAQVWPFDASLRWPREIAGRAMDTYHRWMEVTIYATLAGLPAISVPAGFGPDGLPMGLQLIGRPRGDRALLVLAKAYEEIASDLYARRPTD
ncbi:MAG: amidase [Burkholderiales bacterium]